MINWKLVLYMALFVIVWIFTVAFYGVFSSVKPKRYVSDETPADFNMSYENITLKTADGVKISAWFIPNDKTKKAIVICHGYPFDKGNVLTFATFLRKRYNIMMFDFRAMGRSGGWYTSGGYYEKRDLMAAIEYLKKDRGIGPIGVFGFSIGGSVAIMTAELSEDIKVVVADSLTASLEYVVDSMYRQFSFFKHPFVFMTKLIAKIFFGIDTSKVSAVRSAPNMKSALLLIHGDIDDQVPVEESKMVYKEAKEPKELWIVKGANHGKAHAIMGRKYEKRVMDFFEKYLSNRG
jgi:dipeptidyl aminopeptidase/acylaminoacyl peptidase